MAKSVFEKINEEASEYVGTSKQKIQVSEEIVDALMQTFEEKGKFTIEVGKLNRMIGYDSSNNRRPQILSSIRAKWSDKTPEGKELYIATTEEDTKYVVSVRDIPKKKDKKEIKEN